jgi:hypothetical protein
VAAEFDFIKPPSDVWFPCYFADNQALPLNRRTKTTISSSRPRPPP